MRTRNDVRARVIALTMISIGVLGLIIAEPWSGWDDDWEDNEQALDPEFVVAVSALQSGNYQVAVEALQEFRIRAPHVPEVYVNLGFAYLGNGQPLEAENAFQKALQLQPAQANAYYGLGLLYENKGDMELARGAMRTFIHLADESDRFLPRARAALWEWENSPN